MVVEPGITMTWARRGEWTGTGADRADRGPRAGPVTPRPLDHRHRRACGRGGETWGDTHFARSLAAALERRGQHVAVDPAPARARWSRSLDDVVLVLRDWTPSYRGPGHCRCSG